MRYRQRRRPMPPLPSSSVSGAAFPRLVPKQYADIDSSCSNNARVIVVHTCNFYDIIRLDIFIRFCTWANQLIVERFLVGQYSVQAWQFTCEWCKLQGSKHFILMWDFRQRKSGGTAKKNIYYKDFFSQMETFTNNLSVYNSTLLILYVFLACKISGNINCSCATCLLKLISY